MAALCPNGLGPVLSGAVAATGFYFGAEIVTIAAAESKEPAIAIAKSTNSVIGRILIFYVCSIFLVVLLVPWNSTQILTPYVSALNVLGIPNAAFIMNIIILVAVLSALNSGLYVSSRMLFALTQNGDAPKFLAKISRHGAPTRAILCGSLFGYVAIIMSYISPNTVFAFLVNSYGTIAIFVYFFIAFSQLRLRFSLQEKSSQLLKIRMWCFPWLTYATIIAMICLIVAMAFIPEQRSSLLLGFVSLFILFLIYNIRLVYLKYKLPKSIKHKVSFAKASDSDRIISILMHNYSRFLQEGKDKERTGFLASTFDKEKLILWIKNKKEFKVLVVKNDLNEVVGYSIGCTLTVARKEKLFNFDLTALIK